VERSKKLILNWKFLHQKKVILSKFQILRLIKVRLWDLKSQIPHKRNPSWSILTLLTLIIFQKIAKMSKNSLQNRKSPSKKSKKSSKRKQNCYKSANKLTLNSREISKQFVMNTHKKRISLVMENHLFPWIRIFSNLKNSRKRFSKSS